MEGQEIQTQEKFDDDVATPKVKKTTKQQQLGNAPTKKGSKASRVTKKAKLGDNLEETSVDKM